MINASEKQAQCYRLRSLILICALFDLLIRFCVVLSYLLQRFLPASFGPILNSVAIMYYVRLATTLTQIVPAVGMIFAWKRRRSRGVLVFVTSKSLYCTVMLGGLIGVSIWMFYPDDCIEAPACFTTSVQEFEECARKRCEWVRQTLALLAISAADWLLSVSFLGVTFICHRLMGLSGIESI